MLSFNKKDRKKRKKSIVKACFSFNFIERQYFLGGLRLQGEAVAGLLTLNAHLVVYHLGTFSHDPLYYSWCENSGYKIGKSMVFHLKN